MKVVNAKSGDTKTPSLLVRLRAAPIKKIDATPWTYIQCQDKRNLRMGSVKTLKTMLIAVASRKRHFFSSLPKAFLNPVQIVK